MEMSTDLRPGHRPDLVRHALLDELSVLLGEIFRVPIREQLQPRRDLGRELLVRGVL